MKKEYSMVSACDVLKREIDLIIRVHLAERWCGYDIVRLSDCPGKKECGMVHCEIINSEEEKAFDQLILDYYEQQDLRAKIRENIKYSNL
jgi:hypothetical protein